MTDKDKVIELMAELRDKIQECLGTMRDKKESMTYLEMSWLAHGLMNDASHIQFECSDLAVKLEGAKDKW